MMRMTQSTRIRLNNLKCSFWVPVRMYAQKETFGMQANEIKGCKVIDY